LPTRFCGVSCPFCWLYMVHVFGVPGAQYATWQFPDPALVHASIQASSELVVTDVTLPVPALTQQLISYTAPGLLDSATFW
jgi:hypothetical protein